MNREIKFRVFVKPENKIHKHIIDVDTLLYETFSKWEKEELVLMQYTGLKDKNGKEIYEGDVVYIPAFNPELNIVRFNRGAFCLEPMPKKNESLGSHFWSDIKYAEDERSEVVGNVYNNPELYNYE